METAEEIEAAIYTCLDALIDLGVSNKEILGMLFDMQCAYREAMYEE